MRKLRFWLAKKIWPKEVKQGELFIIIRHLRDGKPSGDGSWVGETCRADIVDGIRISFSVHNRWKAYPHFERIPTLWLVPGKNCVVKAISVPMTEAKTAKVYAESKTQAP